MSEPTITSTPPSSADKGEMRGESRLTRGQLEATEREFLKKVKHTVENYGYCTVVVSEGVHWPDGRERFDHSQAGWKLSGAHAEIKCRECHTGPRARLTISEGPPMARMLA